jgi:hypothetical protein
MRLWPKRCMNMSVSAFGLTTEDDAPRDDARRLPPIVTRQLLAIAMAPVGMVCGEMLLVPTLTCLQTGASIVNNACAVPGTLYARVYTSMY